MKIKFLYITTLFLVVNPIFSQEEKVVLQKNEELNTIEDIAKNFSSIENRNNDIFQNAQKNNSNHQESSYVMISQIGDYNYSTVNIKSTNAQININQNGYENVVDIDKNANQIREIIDQNGNNNYIQDYSYFSNQNAASNQYKQQGDNLSLYSYGSNSISESISVLQTGSQKSVIIINN
jgi:hypothetical protein